MKIARILLIAAAMGAAAKAGIVCTVSPGVWCEKGAGEAGGLPASSEPTMGTGALNTIIGDLADGTGGADMYSIFIPNTSLFSANYTGYSNGVSPETQAALYLFDFNGNGIEAADDGSVALGGFVGTPGFYYIDIVPDGNVPQYKSGGNSFPIFSTFVSGSVSSPVGGAGPIKNYSKAGCGANCEGGYDISLSGAQYSNLPEPASAGMMMLGLTALAALASMRRRQRR